MEANIENLDQLEALLNLHGGLVAIRRWQKGGKDRLYLNTGILAKSATIYAYETKGRVELSIWIDQGNQSLEWIRDMKKNLRQVVEEITDEAITKFEVTA